MDELQRQLEAFSKRYGTQGYLMKARIEILMKQGKSPEDAVRQVFREFGVEDWLQVNVAKVIVGTAQDALGKEAASTLSTAAILEALSNPWDGSGLTLSEKIHGASNVMLNDVISTLREQIRRNKTVKDTAQALYDGYKSSHVVREQQLPQYLDELTRWTRRSRENLSQEELKDLQRSIRKVRYLADDLVDDRSTYNHFRTSLRELMDKLEHGSEKAAQRALQNAIQEKSRYVAERIARTEGARARYDAFIAQAGEDEDVVAYKWKLGSRHPAEDICDMYAHADLYGLGAGVFPKDQAPVNPAHPHCLCHYAPVYASELKSKKRSDNVEGRGNAWLKRQHIRQAILGVKGEQEWKAGRAGWMEKARNIGITSTYSRFKELVHTLKSSIISVDKLRAGKFPTTQDEIDDILSKELSGIRFSSKPTYNSRIRSPGKTTISISSLGSRQIKSMEIGKQFKEGKNELIDTLIHEELEARIGLKADKAVKFSRLENASEAIRHKYINAVIERFFAFKGWEYE
jgi:hypothetical protein